MVFPVLFLACLFFFGEKEEKCSEPEHQLQPLPDQFTQGGDHLLHPPPAGPLLPGHGVPDLHLTQICSLSLLDNKQDAEHGACIS